MVALKANKMAAMVVSKMTALKSRLHGCDVGEQDGCDEGRLDVAMWVSWMAAMKVDSMVPMLVS
jgi:hypothetical protein